ncbi:RidA family protein [Micromonospora sp. MS34]|uniref:RidA family protein n=1 Tax=Micromonospora sp. MS34 TaxID=3385971 RepID=UPI0039A21103
MINAIHTENAPFVRFPDGSEPPLSQAVTVGDLVFTSGQGPLDPVTHVIPDDFADQVRQVLDNLVAVLEAAGSSKNLIVKCTCYLDDGRNLATFNRVYRDYFAESPVLPARTTVITKLVREGVRIEVDGVAAVAR